MRHECIESAVQTVEQKRKESAELTYSKLMENTLNAQNQKQEILKETKAKL